MDSAIPHACAAIAKPAALAYQRSSAGLIERLDAVLRLGTTQWAGAALEPMRDKGLAHDHVRLIGAGAIARIPKQSQMNLPADENLAYQAACFRRACVSGHAPHLLDVLRPSALLPHGALIVEEIKGRVVRLPQDLPALATALARIHALPVPTPQARRPLLDAPDPLAALLGEIETQGYHLDAARLAPRARRTIEDEIDQLSALCAASDRPTRRLIAFDTHPGNFIVRPDGVAVLVDLEKVRYAYPSLDLAHATLYTSTTWDIDSAAVLAVADIAMAYRHWGRLLGQGAEAARRWHVPLRRAMWLWSVTWCAKWRALSGGQAKGDGSGEDWSAENSDAALIAHVRNRVDHYLSPAVIARNVAEFAALDQVFGATGLAVERPG